MKIGINGIAGRIGKFTAYELIKQGNEIGAVNDLASTNNIVESLSHKDVMHGSLDWKVEKIDDESISINGKRIKVCHEKDPSLIKWGQEIAAVDECAGPFVAKEDLEKHFTKGPNLETVLLSAPGKGDMKTLVMGVNHTNYTKQDKIISNASCTTKALALPMQVILDSGLPIYGVLMDTTHAATNTQKPLDFMASYGVLDTIQSAKTGAAIATGSVIPYLDGKMDGFAMRVPTRDGSFANVYFVTDGVESVSEKINSLFERAKDNPKYCNRLDTFKGSEIASPDIIGNTASSVIAISKTKVIPFKIDGKSLALVGIVSGYDNERGPAKDLALLTKYVLEH